MNAVAEMTQNRLLRRADWRFLVGVPDPACAYCPSRGLLRDAVAMVAERLVGRAPTGECDLAVLLNPNRRQLEAARAALEPGGGLYAEWWRPVAGGANTLRDRLEQAGFEQIACYWPWPVPCGLDPRFWLPLDVPEAALWFLDNRAVRPKRHPGGAIPFIYWVWRRLSRVGALSPTCAVARKPSPSARSSKLARGRNGSGGSLPVTLAGYHARWGLPHDSVGCLLLTGGQSPGNKLVVLTFSAGQPAPQLAVKLPRVGDAQAPLEHEGQVLQAVHADRVRSGVPRVVGRVDVGDRVGLAQSVVTGTPVQELLRPATHRQLCLKVTDFLADLAATPPPRWSAEWKDRLVRPVLDVLGEAERRRARAILCGLSLLPEVCEQRDCSPWNVLVRSDGRLAILDWESAEPRGVPGLDLVYFLSYASFFAERVLHSGDELDSYGRMIASSGATGRVYAECVTRYAKRVGLDQTWLRPLRLLCWLVHARTSGVREGNLDGSRSSRDAAVFLQLARHELADQGNGP